MKVWHPRETIRQRRMELGLTPAMLARKVGVTQTCVWNWEQGNTWPRAHNVVALARVLGVQPADLMLKAEPGDEPATTEEVLSSPGIDQILEDAKAAIAVALGLPRDRVQVTFSVAA